MIGCACEVCRSTNPKNHRYRCAVLIRTPQGNILIDTPPELRLQLVREHVGLIHAVLFTHYHVDHLFGLDDLRPVPKYLGGPVPLYCAEDTERIIRQSFAYAFTPEAAQWPVGFVPQLVFRRIEGSKPFRVLEQDILPVPLIHNKFDVFGFRVDDVAYCTDVNRIEPESMAMLYDLRVLVLDALRYKPHPAHFSLNEALDVIAELRPQKAYLTHMSHEIDYEVVSRQLPPNVALAYDGLSFEF